MRRHAPRNPGNAVTRRAIGRTIAASVPHDLAVPRILAAWEEAQGTSEHETGLAFYPAAHELAGRIAHAYGRPPAYGAIALAALSPRLPWQWNREAGERIAAGNWDDRRPLPECTDKAWRILVDGDPSAIGWGCKTRSFALNIARPHSAGPVTLDTHSTSLLYGRPLDERALKVLDRRAGYAWHAIPYRAAARRLGVLPHTLQSVTWHHWRHVTGVDWRDSLREEEF